MASETTSIQTETAAEVGSSPAASSSRATGLARRGDGFSVGETEGLLQLVRERWQEGWDVVADVHNQQYPGHNRTGPSLKRKFGKLYRTKLEDPGLSHKVARLAAIAKDVREEMRGRARTVPRSRAVSVDPSVSEASFMEKEEQEPGLGEQVDTEQQDVDHQQRALLEQSVTLDREIRQTLESAAPPLEQDAQQVEQSVAVSQELQDQMADWEAIRALRARIEQRDGAMPLAQDDDLLRTVLTTILNTQQRLDIERVQENEQRRKEDEQRREEEREERRRRDEERAEDRRRHEEYMQMMASMMAKIAGDRLQEQKM